MTAPPGDEPQGQAGPERQDVEGQEAERSGLEGRQAEAQGVPAAPAARGQEAEVTAHPPSELGAGAAELYAWVTGAASSVGHGHAQHGAPSMSPIPAASGPLQPVDGSPAVRGGRPGAPHGQSSAGPAGQSAQAPGIPSAGEPVDPSSGEPADQSSGGPAARAEPADAESSTQTDPTPSGRPRRRTAALAGALALAVAAVGWFSTENARKGWWELGDHVALTPDAQGWAHLGQVQVRLAGATSEARIDPQEAPPRGFTYLALTFEVTSEQTEEPSSCEVSVLDGEGRLFEAGVWVPREGDTYSSSLTCGTSDPVEDPVEPTQSMLVLLPEDADPVSVRVTSRDFPPTQLIELGLP